MLVESGEMNHPNGKSRGCNLGSRSLNPHPERQTVAQCFAYVDMAYN